MISDPARAYDTDCLSKMSVIEAAPSDSVAACVPIETREAADAGESAGPKYNEAAGSPAWFLKKRRARRQRLSIRFGAMVAELSS
jgi:hypothetical protein